MIRNKFWSTFSYFTNDELEEGIKEIEKSLDPNTQ